MEPPPISFCKCRFAMNRFRIRTVFLEAECKQIYKNNEQRNSFSISRVWRFYITPKLWKCKAILKKTILLLNVDDQ